MRSSFFLFCWEVFKTEPAAISGQKISPVSNISCFMTTASGGDQLLFCHFVHGGGNDLGVFHELGDLNEFVGLVLTDFIAGEDGAEGKNVG